MVTAAPNVGVLALQGNVAAHVDKLAALGATTTSVRVPDDLVGVDALVLPGGESTTMSRLVELAGLFEPLGDVLAAGTPVLGTCAGLIMLATDVVDGRSDQRTFGVLSATVRRNAYGRQNQSFETRLAQREEQWSPHSVERPDAGGESGTRGSVDDADADTSAADAMTAVFIRAPRIEACADSVTALAEFDGHPVLVEQGSILGATFHPELTPDLRVHRRLLDKVH